MDLNKPFKLYSNCRLVRGVQRSTICDLQRNRFHLIPNSLYDLLTDYQGRSIDQIKAGYDNEFDEIIEEYFDFLFKEELIFFTDIPGQFPELSLHWESPSTITYAILDIGPAVEENFNSICEQLNELDCKYVEVRAYEALPIDRLRSLLAAFNDTTIISISLILKYSGEIEEAEWMEFCDNCSRITSLTVHGSVYEKVTTSKRYLIPIAFIVPAIASEQCCGLIKPEYFSSYTETFTESLKYNSCLNKKLGIDINGNIKNCPSLQQSFGNVATTSLREAVFQEGFKQFWKITKDAIQTCKHCEFRYICTDCRAYLEVPSDELSKPLKCGYDPYTCSWEDWVKVPVKQRAIEHYNLKELIKNS